MLKGGQQFTQPVEHRHAVVRHFAKAGETKTISCVFLQLQYAFFDALMQRIKLLIVLGG